MGEGSLLQNSAGALPVESQCEPSVRAPWGLSLSESLCDPPCFLTMETLPFGSQCGPSYPKRGLEGQGPLPPFVTSGGPMFFNSMGLHVMDAAGRSPTSYSNLQSQDTPAGVISESHCRSTPAGAPLMAPHGGHSRETQSSQSYHRCPVKHPCCTSIYPCPIQL
ncbi:unnamed protein product [Leuciscus chuanchicus]